MTGAIVAPVPPDVRALLQRVVDETVAVLNVDGAAIGLVTPEGSAVDRIVATATATPERDGAPGASPDSLDDLGALDALCLRVGGGLPAGVGATDDAVLLEDLPEAETTAPPGLRAVVGAPLAGRDGAVRGVLCVFDRGGRGLAGRDRALLRVLADAASGAIENAELAARLTEAETRHRFVLDRLPDVIWAADADRIFTYVSAGSERLLGYRPDELVGGSSQVIMHESSRQAFEAGFRWQIGHPDSDQTYRVNLRHRDGHAVPVELHNIGTPVNGRYGGGTGSVREMTERDRLEREIRAQAAELAASRERAHLAQELHDSVTQALFSMKITAGAARMLLERNEPGVDAKLDELSALASEALSEMRSLILELRPGGVAEEGFLPALRKHLAAVQGRTGLAVRLEVDPGLGRLPLATEDALYRIAQEAVHNIVKHAGAGEVRIGIAASTVDVRMEISDDGAGFEPASRTDGLGLAGMAARAERIGGSVSVDSAPGRGTSISVLIPGRATDSDAADVIAT